MEADVGPKSCVLNCSSHAFCKAASSEVEPRQVASSISVYNVYINMYRCVCVCVHVGTISKVSEIAKMHFFAKADPPLISS